MARVEARIKIKRWNHPGEPNDGYRLLACRYRPPGVHKDAESGDEWMPQLGPSHELHADDYGKHGPPIDWTKYRRRYFVEMKGQREPIAALARVARGRVKNHVVWLRVGEPK
jgi:uncharacterized protein YeaO (DUF488 family)